MERETIRYAPFATRYPGRTQAAHLSNMSDEPSRQNKN